MKYDNLYPPLVERIYNEATDIKSAKKRLHQLYGAYNSANIHKKAEKILYSERFSECESPESEAFKIMRLHASTKERLPHISEFYQFITDHTGNPETILDLGCGFNPFSLHFMPKKPKTC